MGIALGSEQIDRAGVVPFLCHFWCHFQGDVLLTTPGDVKSLELRFLEQLDLANDRQARRNTTQMRWGKTTFCHAWPMPAPKGLDGIHVYNI